jgi:hypothetical protein
MSARHWQSASGLLYFNRTLRGKTRELKTNVRPQAEDVM